MCGIRRTFEYAMIKAHYGKRIARRSRVSLINHINEGLIIMEHRRASMEAMRAFCIHPLSQPDDMIKGFLIDAKNYTPAVILLAMEYRSVANRHLPGHTDNIDVGPLSDVREMLIADKVQNQKDFALYHRGTHERSDLLDQYFSDWFDALGILPPDTNPLTQLISQKES